MWQSVGLVVVALATVLAGCDPSSIGQEEPAAASEPAESEPAAASEPAESEPAAASEPAEQRDLPDDFDLSGDLGAHDPSMVLTEDGYVVYATNDGLRARTSSDLSEFQVTGEAFPDGVDWAAQFADGNPRALWAPDVSQHDGTYYLYYSASTFGSQTSAIGLATSATGLPGSWTDHGEVISTGPGDDFNAIDPSLIVDASGDWWLTLGSFWDGIKMISIDPATGMQSADDTTIHSVASRGGDAIEGADMIEHDGAYYLFVAFDRCCAGTDSTYRVMVGRSDSPTGPFVDQSGSAMLDGGGTEILATNGDVIGPGGADVYSEGGDDLLVYHYYDGANNGAAHLAIDRIEWVDGWPQIN
jgi:arabinan endo-1,5-alpha-L-arabinosidase